MTARTTTDAPVGDWLVVPNPPVIRGWRWGRIVEQLPGPGPARFRVRWVGNDRDSLVVPAVGYRIESAARWPVPPSSAIGLWPDPADHPDHPDHVGDGQAGR
jgi:hypothetical protein